MKQRDIWRGVVAAGAISLALAAPMGMAQSDPEIEFSNQARHWETQGRDDLARESWLRLLRVSPDNPNALAGLSLAEARSGRQSAAGVYLERLRKVAPNHPDIPRAEAAMRTASFDQKRLDQPRQLAKDGRFEDAVKQYEQAFDGKVPNSRLGLEYYQTLAGTEGGWEPARKGLQGLVDANPDEGIFKVALAQHLTYQESTRRDGLQQLSTLADDKSVESQVRQAWRQGLIWLSAKPGDLPLYRGFVRRFGDDSEVSKRLAALEKVGPGGTVATLESGEVRSYPGPQAAQAAAAPGQRSAEPTAEEIFGGRVQQAFKQLNDGDITGAEQAFASLMAQQPGNADALGGMGIVMLRQERYAEARNLLDRATQADPRTANRWREALGSARFWEAVRGADAAREAGRIDEAVQRLRSAMASNPEIAQRQPEIRSTLADVLLQQGNRDEAEQIYRELLASDPENLTAIRGLIGIYSQSNRLQDAISLAQRLPPRLQNEIGNLGQLRGQFLRDQADQAISQRDDATAQRLLKEALLLDPESPWTRLSLARIYQREGRTREANTLVDGLITEGKQLADAYYIKSLLLSEQQDWFNALQVLEKIPPPNRTADMASMQRRLWIRYETERAAVFARYGRLEEAMQILVVVEPYVDETPELLGALATAWAAVGDETRAMSYMRQALSRVPNPDIGMRLQYAGLLFALRQDAEFEVVMEDLVRQTGFNEQQSLQMANMRIAYRLRQADLVREDGQLAQAYEYLEPLLRVNPNDPRVLMALARLYNDAREYDRVLALNRRVLQVDPQNVDAFRSAINASLAMNDLDQAEQLLDEAFSLEPNSSRLYALAGRAARARGEDGRALQLFQHALRLEQETGGGEGGSGAPYSPRLFLVEPQQSPVFRQGFSGEAPPSSWEFPSLDSAKKKPLEIDTQRLISMRRADYSEEAYAAPLDGLLVRVSTVVEVRPQVSAGIPGAQGGVWVQQDNDVYVYQPSRPTTQAPSVPQYGGANSPVMPGVPGQMPAGTTMQPSWQAPASGPVFSRQAPVVTAPRRQIPTSGGFQREVMGEIEAITGSQGGFPVQQAPRGLATQLSMPRSQYPAPPVQQPVPQSGWQGQVVPSVPAPTYGTPVRGGAVTQGPSLPMESIRPRNEVDWGAPVESYQAQGLRVLPSGEAYYGQQMSPQLGAPVVPQPPVQTPAFPARVPRAPEVQLRQDPLLSRPSFAIQRGASQPDAPGYALLREIADLRARRSNWASMGLSLRSRDGVAGLDELTNIEMPIEVSFAGERAGRISLRLVPVFLDAGTVSGAQLPLFGSLALVDPDLLAGRSFGQSESGIAVGAAYQAGTFRADIGSSPLGFPIETIVGGLNWQPSVDDTSFKIDLARRSVTDSMLSYAGAFDPGLGEDWGGVTKTGGRLDVSQGLGDYGIYGNVGYHVYDGENVARNNAYELGAGFYARALERPNTRVTWGLNLTTFAYDKNLRRFTFGHGGYFSPQSYVALSIPVEWEGGRNRLSYRLSASLGIQGFREDGTALYPNDSGLQAAIEQLVLDSPDLDLVAGYSGQSSTGVGFSLGGTLEYLITSQLVAGARVGLDNARDYDEAYASAYLRYLMTPQGRVSIPPAPLFPHYNFGDPRL